jgi:hypothetical protein
MKLKKIKVNEEVGKVIKYAWNKLAWFALILILLLFATPLIGSLIWVVLTCFISLIVSYVYSTLKIASMRLNKDKPIFLIKPLLYNFFYQMMRRRDRKNQIYQKPPIKTIESILNKRESRLVSRGLDMLEISYLKEVVSYRSTKYIGQPKKGYTNKVSFHRNG